MLRTYWLVNTRTGEIMDEISGKEGDGAVLCKWYRQVRSDADLQIFDVTGGEL